MKRDRNFDDLAEKFQRKIYGGLKGRVRLAVLQRDLENILPSIPAGNSLRILDAGSGQGALSLRFAQMGHQITLCDISEKMLELALASVAAAGIGQRVRVINDAIQNLSRYEIGSFDLILNHALLEWTAEPDAILPLLAKHLAVNGVISTAFYNHSGILFRNLQRGNLYKVANKDWRGDPGSLTPSNPPTIEEVRNWHKEAGLHTLSWSGIRVFSDYLSRDKLEQIPESDIIAQELAFSSHPDLWRMARYIHVLSRRADDRDNVQ